MRRRYGPAADARLDALIDAACAQVGDAARETAYRTVQRFVDDEALVVPLYTPDRLALATPAAPAFRLTRDLYRIEFESAP